MLSFRSAMIKSDHDDHGHDQHAKRERHHVAACVNP
jgi:hypothetical protein